MYQYRRLIRTSIKKKKTEQTAHLKKFNLVSIAQQSNFEEERFMFETSALLRSDQKLVHR